MIPKSAGRTPIACSNCAKTKTKCDKKFPCSRCASRNLKCTLRPTRRQSKNANRMQVNADGTANSTEATQTQTATPEGSKSSSPQPQRQQSEQQDAPPVSTRTPQPPSQHQSPAAHRPSIESTPSFFIEQSPASGPPSVLPTTLSPLPTPGTMQSNSFVNTTPLSGMEEFGPRKSDASDAASPPFLMDWSQLQFTQPPPQFETMGRPDVMMASGLGMTMGGLAETEPTLFSIPELGHALPVTSPPMATPRMDGTMSDLEMGSSAGMFYPHTRHASFSDTGAMEISAVIAAQDGWNCFKSAPTIPSSSCPKTAGLHLERLEQSLKNHEGWSSWRLAWEDTDTSQDNLQVRPFQEASRDKLLAITQTFLHKALDIHREGNTGTPSGGGTPCSTSSNFVLLPPSRVLEYFLRSYGNSFERFFPITARGLLDANDQLLNAHNDKASSLLILMMIAQGAMAIPSLDARWLNGGLTEACRISLFDLIEKNISMASDHTVLHSALLFISLAAWSGDKWQMDIAMGQRGMYFAMLRHSGILEPRHAMTPPVHLRGTTDGLWSDWLQHESKSR
jgi:Fungal Zn(2)-Cys(6) binuclear cluster domain